MGFKPVSTKLWRKWLKYRGLVHIRTEGHEIWDYPDDSLLRPVTFRPSKKEIPGFHIHTCLKTLSVDYKTFEEELKKL